MTTDSYKEVAQCASSVLAQEIITQQYSTPPHQRKECTKFMRLTACKDVDAMETSKIWKTLTVPLHDTEVQSMLGRSGLISRELASVPHCSEATLINNIRKITDNQGCLFCMQWPESRYYRHYECLQSRHGFIHKYAAISHVLAGCGPAFWFDIPKTVHLIWNSATGRGRWVFHNVKQGESGCLEWEFATMNHQEDMSRLIAPGHSNIIGGDNCMNRFCRICIRC